MCNKRENENIVFSTPTSTTRVLVELCGVAGVEDCISGVVGVVDGVILREICVRRMMCHGYKKKLKT